MMLPQSKIERPGGLFLYIVMRANTGRLHRMRSDDPVAHIEIVHGLLDQVAAGFCHVEVPVGRRSVVR